MDTKNTARAGTYLSMVLGCKTPSKSSWINFSVTGIARCAPHKYNFLVEFFLGIKSESMRLTENPS